MSMHGNMHVAHAHPEVTSVAIARQDLTNLSSKQIMLEVEYQSYFYVSRLMNSYTEVVYSGFPSAMPYIAYQTRFQQVSQT